ncbi:Alpha/Beta hydrolase protein [Auriculariales sp. MPI-PUGE-AT-0066]|nr:Alpha/Beta hydrolase protein [Auriculariales sp. MPI-PUGE-AT-0066]
MSAGHDLETYLLPSGQSKQLAVLLHPWSWLGGNCRDPVLHELADSLHEAGFHVLRFNSRGVGQSTGRASFNGQAEVDDLLELVQHTIQQAFSDVRRLVLIGYSHGSMICSRFPLNALGQVQVHHVLLSYPLAYRGVLTLFSAGTYQKALTTLLAEPGSRVLIIHGDRDDFTSTSKYNSWTEDLKTHAKGSLMVEVVNGATHFWVGQYRAKLRSAVVEWVVSADDTTHVAQQE